MTLVELIAEVVETTDITNRYFTIETYAITNDWTGWQNKVILHPTDRGRFYSRQVDLEPGDRQIWVGVTNFVGSWRFRIKVKVVSTGQVIADIDDYHAEDVFVNSYTVNVPNALNPPGDVVGGTLDMSPVVQQMMNTMMPMMMNIITMSMMIQMMAGLIGSMTTGIAGAF